MSPHTKGHFVVRVGRLEGIAIGSDPGEMGERNDGERCLYDDLRSLGCS